MVGLKLERVTYSHYFKAIGPPAFSASSPANKTALPVIFIVHIEWSMLELT